VREKSNSVKLVLILLIIAALTALCLGLVNYITADKIASIKSEATQAAMKEVLPGEYVFVSTSLPWDVSDADAPPFADASIVRAVYEAEDSASGDGSRLIAGYAIEVAPSGFGGEITMIVGVDTSGKVTGVSIVDMSETSGLGTNAKNADFREQYLLYDAPYAVNKDGGEIKAITGATVTSRAVTRGVNAAVDTVKLILSGADGGVTRDAAVSEASAEPVVPSEPAEEG